MYSARFGNAPRTGEPAGPTSLYPPGAQAGARRVSDSVYRGSTVCSLTKSTKGAWEQHICAGTLYHTPYACPRLSKSISCIRRSGFCDERVDAKCYSANEHQLGDGAHTLGEDTLARAFCAS